MLSGQPSGGGGGTTSQAPSTNTDNTGGGGGGGGGGGEQLSPEERLARRYRVQLNILEGMGFLERAANLQGTLYVYNTRCTRTVNALSCRIKYLSWPFLILFAVHVSY